MIRKIAPSLVGVALSVFSLAIASETNPSGDAGEMAVCNDSVSSPTRLFFAMQIADETGHILAEPKLVGMCGVPLEMTLRDPATSGSPRMSLWLRPDSHSDGSYEVAFELSVVGRVKKGKGKVQVRSGEEKSTKVGYPGGHLRVQLAAFSVGSQELDLYLKNGMQNQLSQPGRT